MQVSSFDYFPIPLSMRMRFGGLLQMNLEVKSIKRGKIDRSVFEIPSGYKEVDPAELSDMFKGFGQPRGGRGR